MLFSLFPTLQPGRIEGHPTRDRGGLGYTAEGSKQLICTYYRMPCAFRRSVRNNSQERLIFFQCIKLFQIPADRGGGRGGVGTISWGLYQYISSIHNVEGNLEIGNPKKA